MDQWDKGTRNTQMVTRTGNIYICRIATGCGRHLTGLQEVDKVGWKQQALEHRHWGESPTMPGGTVAPGPKCRRLGEEELGDDCSQKDD
eukprot:scaffold71659_cov57-Attheya_sp.AAC.9